MQSFLKPLTLTPPILFSRLTMMVSLTNKISRDVETGKQLDLIFDSLLYDVSIVYSIANVASGIYTMASSNDRNIASFTKKYEKVANKTIKKLVENISDKAE